MLKKLKNAFFAMLAFSCFAFTFIACPQPTTTDGGGSEATLSLSESSITLTTVGETKQIKATYTGSSTLSWTVEDSSIATVEVASDTLSATVKALKAGSTTLTVKEANGSLSASVKITNSISAQAVSDLKKTSADSSSVTISWTAPTNYESFTVKAFSVSDSGEAEISLENNTTKESSFTISNLKANTTYKFYVYTNYGGVTSTAQSIEVTTSSISIDLSLDSTINFEEAQSAGTTFTLVAKITDSSSETNTLTISEWTSSNTEIATVTADETDSNKATVSIVGPSGTVNITATIKDGDSELASKSYPVAIIGKAVNSSNVAVTVQSSASDETLSDKQVKVSWDAPSYVTSYKVELYKVDSADATIAEDASADVTSPADGKDAITTTSVTLTVSDYGYYIAKVYSIYGNDTSSGVTSSATQVKDFKPCDNVSGVKLDLSATTPSLTWSDPSDSDLESIEISVDSTTVTVAAGKKKYEDKSLSSASSIKITTKDTAGNKSSGVTVTVGTAPSLSTSSTTTTGYTGQLVVSGLELTSGVTYTVKYAGEVEGATAILDADNSKVYINGLTVGTEETPKFTLTATYSDYTVVYPTLSGTATKPTMTVWKLANGYRGSNDDEEYFMAFDLTSDRTYANGVIAKASERSEHGCTYDRFIVWPGLDNGTGNYVSLELSKIGDSGLDESGYYVISKNDTTNKELWWRTNSWNDWANEYTTFAVQESNISDKSTATYIVNTSSYTSTTTNYDYVTLNWAADTTRYIRGCCFHSVTLVPGSSTTADDGTEALTGKDYAWAPLSQTWSGSESSDNPTEITVESSVTDHSITLTWTDPSDVDFSYLTISSEGTLLDGTTIETQKIAAGTQTATFTKLSANKSYSFIITEYDAFGNETTVTPEAIPTSEDKTAPSAPTALLDGVGFSSAKISVTKPSDSDVKGIVVTTASSSSSITDDNTITAATDENYYATDLTADTTYYVFAYDYDGNYSDATTVTVELTEFSATAQVKYTGSILVTWNDVTDYASNGTTITYTYEVSGVGDSEYTVDSGVGKKHITGLTVGTEYTPKVTVLSGTTEKGSATCTSVTAKTVIWQIASGYKNASSVSSATNFLGWAKSKSSTTSYNTACLPSDGTYTAKYWIVHPALSGTEDYFSLEAATDTSGLGTGYYLYANPGVTRSDAYVAYTINWCNSNSMSYALVASKTGVENSGTSYITDNKMASFYWETSSWNSSWYKMYNEYSSGYYVQHANFTYGITNGSEDGSGCGAFGIYSTAYSDKDYTADSPSAPTNASATATSSSSVKLSWTNPSDVDFSYVKIAYTVDSTEKSVIVAGTAGEESSTTITGLSDNTSYSFAITAYDVYGNASESTASASVTTPISLTNVAQNVKATARFTGEILVTWDRAQDDTSNTWYYKVVPSNSSLTEYASTNELTSYAGTYTAAANGVAQFKGLTSGTEYTFTVYASEDNSTWNSDTTYSTTTVSATAATVSKKFYSYTNPDKNDNSRYLNLPFALNNFNWQWATNGGNAVWTLYPAFDGTITVEHSVTTSDKTETGVYDTFSLLYTNKSVYLYLDLESVTDTAVTSSSTYVKTASDTSSWTDTIKKEATFFMGYSTTASNYMLRLNYKNWSIGQATTNGSFPITNDATITTVESSQYAWTLIDQFLLLELLKAQNYAWYFN